MTTWGGVITVRLRGVKIDRFRSIADQWLPMEGLVVLFGQNSAGKTSVLEAVEHLITQAGRFRADPGEIEETSVDGSLVFDLPGAHIPGSPDAQIYRALLRDEYSRPGAFGKSKYPWPWLDAELAARLKKADLEPAISLLSEALARTGASGTAEDREALANSVFDPSAVYFFAHKLNVSLLVDGSSLPKQAMDAARRIASVPGDDPLWTLASHLVPNGRAHLAVLSGGVHKRWQKFADSFPPVIVLDGNIESLSADLESAVIAIHNQLWPWVRKPFPFSLNIGAVYVTHKEDIGKGRQDDRYAADSWLETQSEGGQVFTASAFDPYNQGDWYRVRHSVLAAARVLEEEANKVAPAFVKDQGSIGIEVLPVAVWGSSKHKVRATFTELDGERRDLSVVGAGTARWAAAAIRLASRGLEKGRVIRDEAGDPVDGEDELERIQAEAFKEAFEEALGRLKPSYLPAVYIADEPESHLHPAALQSVREWLSQLAATAATVVIATHSTALLDSPSQLFKGQSQLVKRIKVLRGEHGTELRPMTGALGYELAEVSDMMGLTKGELLLMTRLALFVEGVHDQIILNEWFGDILRTAGIRVFPVQGVDYMPGLIDSEIIPELGIRIATISDDTSIPRVRSGKPRTRGDRGISKLIDNARRAGIPVHSVGLSKPDILYYLDEGICRQISPTFPGWEKATSERPDGSHEPWKRWVKSRYGLPLNNEGIRSLARKCRELDKIPTELVRQVNDLIAYASDSPPAADPDQDH